MKKMFSLVMVAGFLIAASNVLGQEQASAPTFQEEDFWQFKVTEKDFPGYSSAAYDGIYELSYSQGSMKVFKLTGDQKEEIVGEDNLLFGLVGRSKTQQDLKFPLFVGQKWNFDYRFTPRGARASFTRSAEVRVVGIAEVGTAAGTFQAFKIEKYDVWTPQFGGPVGSVTTYFYSPATKSVVKSYFESELPGGTAGGGKREIELIKFGSVVK